MASVAATGSVGAAMARADRGPGGAGVESGLAAAAPPAPTPPPTAPAATVSPTARSGTATTLPADGTWTGPAEFTRWGNVQVQVTIAGGKIVDVTALQIPSDRKSGSINGRAQPILEAEAIAQQGADLDIVSGATYTSRTYAASLQAALDAAAHGTAKTHTA